MFLGVLAQRIAFDAPTRRGYVCKINKVKIFIDHFEQLSPLAAAAAAAAGRWGWVFERMVR